MKVESTIQLCGYDVRIRYCAAAETGFEQISGKSSEIFMPSIEDGDLKQKATLDDYLKLAIAAIIAAYSADNSTPPMNAEDVLYEASPDEVVALIGKVAELRNEWYGIPKVIKEEPGSITDEEKQGKNA